MFIDLVVVCGYVLILFPVLCIYSNRFGPRDMEVEVRMATSFISQEQAKSNLERELPFKRTFDDLKEESASVWNKCVPHQNIKVVAVDLL